MSAKKKAKKRLPKPVPCECWCFTQRDGSIWPGWVAESRRQAREWLSIMPDPGRVIRVRITPVAKRRKGAPR